MRLSAVFTAIVVFAAPAIGQAGLVLGPVSASTDMGSFAFSTPANVINQTGLSTGYTSLVTDFDAYIASNPTHDLGLGPDNSWGSSPQNDTGNFDFDLNGTYTIESFALWNAGDNLGSNVTEFTLLAADNAGFNNATVLGSYNADPNTGPAGAVLPEVFSFTPTEASFVRMQITSIFLPDTGNRNAFLGEAAFEVQTAAVPEPASLAFMAMAVLMLCGIGFLRRRRHNADVGVGVSVAPA